LNAKVKALETEREQLQNRLASIGRDQQGTDEAISLLKEKDERNKALESSQITPIRSPTFK
jgi:hypothetical protein